MDEMDLTGQNPEIIANLLSQATKAAEPGDLMDNPVLNEGDKKSPLPTVVTELQSAGYMYIWDTVTGERSLTNKNMLPTQLKKLRPNGQRYFTTIDPGVIPARGTHRCMLHPEGANRSQYDRLGFAVCQKANLTNEYQVRRHMEKRHKDEWRAIQEEITEARRDEDRAAQRMMMEAVSKLVSNQTPVTRAESSEPELYVSDADRKKQNTSGAKAKKK